MSAVVTHQAPKLRLTRRGRVVFGAFATVLVAALLAAIAAFAAPQAQASNASEVAEFEYVVARPGMPLWSLATELDPGTDPRDLVAEIVQLNQLEDSGVQAGEAIAVPLRYADSATVVSGAELGFPSADAQ